MFEKRGVELRSLTEQIDSTTPSGRLQFHLFGTLAEFEGDLIRQRVNTGLKAARARGRLGGRKKKLKDSDMEKARVLLDSGKYSMGQVAKEL